MKYYLLIKWNRTSYYTRVGKEFSSIEDAYEWYSKTSGDEGRIKSYKIYDENDTQVYLNHK